MNLKWPGWLFDNLGLKLFAVLLATLFYLHVLTDRVAEQVVYFPVELVDLPDSLALAASPPSEAGVRLRGTGKQILRLQYTRPAIRVSLAGVSPGTFQRTFTPADVPVGEAGDVTVVEVTDPQQIQLEVTARAQKRVPVAPALLGTPARGFALSGRPIVRPNVVRLAGPDAWVAKQESLRTEPINIAGRRDTLEVLQALSSPPTWAHAVPGSVLVLVPIEAESSARFEVPVSVRSVRPELSAQANPASVTVIWQGPRSRGEKLTAAGFSARVDAERRGRGEWRLPVRVTGAGQDRVRVEPDSIRVVLH